MTDRGFLNTFPAMTLPIKLISTDFDGTLHADFEDPPVPLRLQELIGELQRRGAKWVINTGRDLPSLMEALARARLSVRPDFLALVEREIYCHEGSQYVSLAEWNDRCESDHADLFAQVKSDLPRLIDWLNTNFDAMIYSDAYSPLCVIAKSNRDMDRMQTYLDDFCREQGTLTAVRNDVYVRFSHVAYNKGTALVEIARRIGARREETFAAGDHLNDLPMLSKDVAEWLVAPVNAVAEVKSLVLGQKGFVSTRACGHGVAEGLEACLQTLGFK